MSTKENFNPFAAMKKLMKSLVLFAAAAMALTSCENEAMNEGIEANDTYTMTFVAGAPESRTSVSISGDKATFSWSENEKVAFVQSRGSKANKVDSNKFEESGETATFGATFSAINDATGDYNYIAVYPSSNYATDNLATDFANDKLRVEIPADQTLTANSFDPKADLMVSKPISAASNITTAQSLEFTRLAAIGRMNLKGVEDGENIEEIVFTIGDANTRLVGRHTIKFSDGTINEASYHGTNSVTLTTPYGGEFLATKTGTPIFFTCLEGDFYGKYSVTVSTDKATYSTDEGKTIAQEKALVFKAGNVLGFNLTVGNRVEKDLSVDYSDKYFVVAKDASNNYWGMKYDTTADYRVATNSNKKSFTTYEDFGFTQEYVWNITKVEGEDAYYIGNYNNSMFITTVTDANNAKVHASTKEKVKLVKDEEGGYFTIQSTSVNSRYLELNAASSRFAFYKQTQVGELYLVPVTGVIKNNLTMTFSESALNFEVGDAVATLPTLSFNPAGTYAVTYSVENTEGNVASVAGNVVSISTAAAGTATVTATFEGNENFNPATASYTVTVKEKQQGGGESSVVEDTLTATILGTGGSYSDWSGKKVNTAVYAGNSMTATGSNAGAIQLRTTNSNSGIVTTTSGGKITKVTITNKSGSNTLQVYGKNTAYTKATDLYDTTKQGTLLGTIKCGTATTLEITGDYAYVGVRSQSGAIYLTDITFTWATGEGGGGTTPEQPGGGDEPETPTEENTVEMNIYGSTGTKASDSSYITWTSGDVTFTNTKGSNAIRTSDTNHYRVYGNGKMTISVAEGTISKVVITCVSGYESVMETSFKNAGYTVSKNGTVVTVAGSGSSFTATASAQTRLSKIAVTYSK